MAMQDGNQLVVLNDSQAFVDIAVAKNIQISHELPHANVRRQLNDFSEQAQYFLLGGGHHGRKSPIRGREAKGLDSLPTTSAQIFVPGDNFAMRDARVTPLYNINTPSVPSNTHGGGMFDVELPNRPIWRASLKASAP
jgi:hypothetical protein